MVPLAEKIKVSVALTTCNHRNFIGEAIESVLAQRCDFAIEIVVGDDASTDGTEEILARYSERYAHQFRYFHFSSKVGGHTNFIHTLNRCRGEYVAMLDGDDYWLDPLKLARQVELMDKVASMGLSFHPVYVLNGDDTKRVIHPPLAWRASVSWKKLLAVNFIPFGSVMYRRHLIPAYPKEFLSFPFGDWWLNLECARGRKVGFLPEVMAVYRVHTQNSWLGRSVIEKIVHSVRFLALYRQRVGIEQNYFFLNKYLDQITYLVHHLKNGLKFKRPVNRFFPHFKICGKIGRSNV